MRTFNLRGFNFQKYPYLGAKYLEAKKQEIKQLRKENEERLVREINRMVLSVIWGLFALITLVAQGVALALPFLIIAMFLYFRGGDFI